ncbi:MAG: hypothetical protein R3E91_04785 [Chlamydiales bacterium]
MSNISQYHPFYPEKAFTHLSTKNSNQEGPHISHSFGFYCSQSSFDSSPWKINQYSSGAAKIGFMFIQIAGYIPIISILGGILRIYACCSKNGLQKGEASVPLGFRVVNVIRGVLEILQLGPLFLIPDLIVTLARYVVSHRNQPQKRLHQLISRISAQEIRKSRYSRQLNPYYENYQKYIDKVLKR